MKKAIEDKILKCGFDMVGVAAADPIPEDFARFDEWLRRGDAAGMDYLERRAPLRLDPATLLPGARSVIVAAAAYEPIVPPGPLAAYSVRHDYHLVFRDALEQVVAHIESTSPTDRCRIVIDTAPLLERAFARRAGIGWIGQSTNLVTERFGPYVLLAEIVTTVDLEPDPPAPPLCGECTRCLDACPTGALAAPFRLDARKCLSYLTIEKRGDFTAPERTLLGVGPSSNDRPAVAQAFGCDLCLEVCPHAEDLIAGKVAPKGHLFPPIEELSIAGLADLEAFCHAGFKKKFGKTPIVRAGRKGLLRNIAAHR